MMNTTILPSEKAVEVVKNLTKIADQLEAANDPQWFSIAKAAMLINGIRLGLLQIENHPSSEVRHA